MNLSELMDRPIAFQRSFVSLGVGITGALMLSQAVYWSNRTEDSEGWFYKTMEEWEAETGMTRSEQEKARKSLGALGVWEEQRKGVPARMFYRVKLPVLERALLGEREPVTLEHVLTHYASVLAGLSKTDLMRARKAKVQAEYVDYAAVLKTHGMTCSICQQPIVREVGQKRGCLAFDHVIPVGAGGAHIADNLRPAHFECHGQKGAALAAQSSSSTQDNLEGAQQTGLSTSNKLACLPKADKPALPQTDSLALGNRTITETTTEITAETTTDILAGEGAAAPTSPGEGGQAPPDTPRCEIPPDMPGPKDPTCKTFKAWANYAFAYRKRYSAWPVWNSRAGGMLGQLVDRLGVNAAPKVAAYYLTISDAQYLRDCHGLGLLLAKAESVHTQWLTNRQVNGTTARQMEHTQANANAAEEAKAMMREGQRNAYL